tara:strand:+ start:525 stop:2993 length:2469 start_codon:yes stop_codon:yes gene_type:complete
MSENAPSKEALKAAKKSESKIEPIDFQCVLLEKIHAISRFNPKFNMVTQLGGTSADPGSIMSRIQHGNRHDTVREMLNLCPDVYASLVPYLRIARVEYDKSDPSKMLPDKEKEIKIPNFLSATDVADITSGKLGRAPGSGIKSFSWELAGVQPAEVDNNITATMVVYFQSLNDFFANASSGSAYQAGKEQEATFLDLIINSPGKPQTSSPSSATSKSPCPPPRAVREYDGVNFRIKATAGWSAPDNLETIFPALGETITLSDGSQAKRGEQLKKAIEDTRVTLFLQQVRHDISVNQDGSVTLTITYQAALSGLGSSETFNILKPTKDTLPESEFKNLESLRQDLKDEKQKENPSDDRIDELLESINSIEQKDRKAKYDALLSGLFSSDKIYQIEVPPEELLIKDLSVLTEAERKEFFKNRGGPSDTTSGTGPRTRAVESAGTESGEDMAEDAEKSIAKSFKKIKKKSGRDGKNQVAISFMYLGDLVDNVLTQIATNSGKPKMNVEMFLTDIDFLDVRKAFSLSDEQLKSVTRCRNQASLDALQNDPHGPGKIYKEINLSEIPISLDLFQSWFIKNVVKKDRTKYYFTQFIKDVVAELVSNSLSNRCYGANNKFRFQQRFDVQPVSYYQKGTLPPDTVIDLANAAAAVTSAAQDADKIKLAFVMISSDSKPKGLRGIPGYDDDLKKGIYHQYMGAACGILKTLNFQREDQPYLREGKIQKNGALGAEQLRELFSVDIALIGNNLFKNGQYTYVSPVLINSSAEQLRLLGLHGYYMITSVKSVVTENSFETTIRALQVGIEFPEEKSVGNSQQTSNGGSPSSAN